MGTKLAIVVVYDISDNGLRRRVEKICKAYGLSHVQRSAFVGFLEESERRALYSKLSGIIELEDYPGEASISCLLYTSPSPRDLSTSRMPSSA